MQTGRFYRGEALMVRAAIRERSLLWLQDGGATLRGGDQDWYPTEWQRRAGCGPTTCAGLLWYLAKTRPACAGLCPGDSCTRAGFVALMEDTWQDVTPGTMGLNSTCLFAEGAERFAARHEVALAARVLDVPDHLHLRPAYGEVADFLVGALSADLPVAFLNLSNGALHNLDSWHWVILVALRGGSAQIYDQGKSLVIRLEKWLATTTLGGGFVYLQPGG